MIVLVLVFLQIPGQLLRMFSASVMFDMASASRLTASIPKKFGTQPVARIR